MASSSIVFGILLSAEHAGGSWIAWILLRHHQRSLPFPRTAISQYPLLPSPQATANKRRNVFFYTPTDIDDHDPTMVSACHISSDEAPDDASEASRSTRFMMHDANLRTCGSFSSVGQAAFSAAASSDPSDVNAVLGFTIEPLRSVVDQCASLPGGGTSSGD
ncbi:hypothetical protein M422DRAFT_260910 [Sphaerobolus stellatus SS14]|uniref:Uncharacterized protein n=1 Tax=Sphaerobolus stellatus (strain SS14) TaxID=990650 RepID=A0A0C9V4B6_SPHS4|nr:hypothetical protein M422DRAFT_260910 [Sphaerobolus stellatus SS14]